MNHIWVKVRLIQEAEVPVRVPDDVPREEQDAYALKVMEATDPSKRLPPSPKLRWEFGPLARDPAKVEALIQAALRMPRATPAAGAAATVHNFPIMAGTVWSLDNALRALGYEYDPTKS